MIELGVGKFKNNAKKKSVIQTNQAIIKIIFSFTFSKSKKIYIKK